MVTSTTPPKLDYQRILEEAHAAARAAVENAEDRWACGFAWVTVDGNSGLARWCRAAAKGSQFTPGHLRRRFYGDKGYPKGHQWWCPGEFPGQSVDAHELGARAFREKLAEYGIRADFNSRLD